MVGHGTRAMGSDGFVDQIQPKHLFAGQITSSCTFFDMKPAISHRIHVWYIYIYHESQLSVGKNTIQDGMGF